MGITAVRDVESVSHEGNRRGAIIYTHSLLEGSMTFIKSQAESLQKHAPIFVGARRHPGLDLPSERTFVVNDGSLRGRVSEVLFRCAGRFPRRLDRVRALDPSIVHAHFGTCGLSALVIAKQLSIPLLVTFHGWDATISPQEAKKTFSGRELLRGKWKLIEQAQGFIAVSDFIRNRLLGLGYPAEKVHLLRNGIDLDFFSPTSSPEKDDPVILFVGRFVEKKGAEHLLEAARIMKHGGVDFRLAMIGSGPLENELRGMANHWQLPCEFHGFMSSLEIRGWLERARVVAVPSVTASNGDSEGLPTVLLEAQAMGTAVVATRHSGIPEGVMDGQTAELVDERDPKALAEALTSFVKDRSKAIEFGRAGQRFVSTHFDLRRQTEKLEDLYLSVQ